jgi:hypothetical protein
LMFSMWLYFLPGRQNLNKATLHRAGGVVVAELTSAGRSKLPTVALVHLLHHTLRRDLLVLTILCHCYWMLRIDSEHNCLLLPTPLL